MTTTNSEMIACDLTVFSKAERERHLATAGDLKGAVLGFMKTPRGIRIILDSTVSSEQLQSWADAERRCCSFLKSARVTREAERVVLDLESNGDGARVWAELFLGLEAARENQSGPGPILGHSNKLAGWKFWKRKRATNQGTSAASDQACGC